MPLLSNSWSKSHSFSQPSELEEIPLCLSSRSFKWKVKKWEIPPWRERGEFWEYIQCPEHYHHTDYYWWWWKQNKLVKKEGHYTHTWFLLKPKGVDILPRIKLNIIPKPSSVPKVQVISFRYLQLQFYNLSQDQVYRSNTLKNFANRPRIIFTHLPARNPSPN